MSIDLEKLKTMNSRERYQLYRKALDRLESGGRELVQLIRSSGLPLNSGEGLRADDPVYLRMEEIIWSPAGRSAALSAAEAGLPPLSGVDPLLQEDLGPAYGPHDLGTANAGYIVAELMRHEGYRKAGTASCPPGCVARTGTKWIRRS